MTPTLRKRHRTIWIIMTVVVLLLVIIALWSKQNPNPINLITN